MGLCNRENILIALPGNNIFTKSICILRKTLSPFCEYDVLRKTSEQEHTTFVVNFTLIRDVLLQRGNSTLKRSQRRSGHTPDELSFNYMAFFYFTYVFLLTRWTGL